MLVEITKTLAAEKLPERPGGATKGRLVMSSS